MIGKKINQLATELAPASTDLTIIGNPTTGVSKKITLAQLGAIFSGAVSFYTNYASFPATGTTDVIFCAKDTQKLYLWSGSAYVEVFPSQALLDTYQLRSEKGNANGYASLDSQGKVPISQLPSSIMEYKGTWSAATNTPTLANGTGDTGDVYICNAAGSVNFGAGAISFAVGDYVIYSGSIWQRSSGAVGTVTSVAATITGDSVTISGSPVTTSGTLAFAFAGTGAQYIKGDGTLATFPTTIDQAKNLITEVYNSTGATLTKGTVVYINGGQGNLPTVTKALATGDSTSAQTYGIVQADITNMNNGYVVVAGRLSDLDTQAYTEGTQLYLSSTTAGAYTSTKQYAPAHLVYVGIIVRSHPTQGIIEVKIQNGYELDELHNVAAQTPSNNDGLFWEASTNLWKNKSLSTILGGTPVFGSGTQNRLARWSSTSGELINSGIQDTGGSITNVLTTAGQYAWQFNGSTSTGLSYGALIVAGTNASDVSFKIMNASATSAYLYMWGDGRLQVNNIPNATTDTDTFLVSDSGIIKYRTGTQLLSDIGGQPAGTYVTSVGLSAPTGFSVSGSPVTSTGTLALSFDTGYSLPTIVKQNNWDTAYNTRIVTASSPLSFISNTISISQASGSTSGYLSSTDWTTFNNKQSALTNPVTGTGTTNYLPKFTGTSTIGNSGISDDGTTVNLNSRVLYGTSATLTGALNGNTANFVIGTSSSMGFTISQNSTFAFGSTNGRRVVQIAYNTGDQPGLQLGYDATDNTGIIAGATQASGAGIDFYTYNGSSWGNRLRLNKEGNLGLGTSSPFAIADTNLSINGSTSSAMQLGVNGIRTGQLFASATEVRLGSITNVPIRFYTNDAESMRLNASGNLSIGNTNDTYKLDVTGTGRFTGTLTAATLTDGYITIGAAQINRTSAIVEMQFAGSGGVRFFGNTAYPITFTSGTGAATFSSSVTATNGILDGTSTYILTLNNSAQDTRLLFNRNGVSNFQISSSTAGTDFYGITNLPLIFYTNGAERLRIASSGNVGIGTTSPSVKLQVEDSSSTSLTTLYLVNSSTAAVTTKQNNLSFRMTDTVGTRKNAFQLTAYSDSSGGNIENGGLIFSGRKADLDTEFMRITSGGSVIVNGTSSAYNSVRQQIWFTGASTQYGLSIAALNTGNTNFIDFNIGSGSSGFAGSISWNGSTVAYNTSSDYRLKQDFKDYSGLDLINKIKTYDYEWKADKSRSYGVIAHELQSVINYAVTGVKDGEQMQGVDYSKIVPVLIKAIQELNDKIK